MITRLQTVVSREISGRDAAVVTVGTFHGGLKENIIPESAEFTLNIRTFDEDVRATVLDRVRRIIAAEAQASGAPEPIIEEMHSFPRASTIPTRPRPSSPRPRPNSVPPTSMSSRQSPARGRRGLRRRDRGPPRLLVLRRVLPRRPRRRRTPGRQPLPALRPRRRADDARDRPAGGLTAVLSRVGK